MTNYNIGKIRRGKGVFLGAAAVLVFSSMGYEGVLADEPVVYASGDGYEEGGYDWETPLDSIYAAQEMLPEGGTIVVTGTFYIDSDREYYLNDGITIQASEDLEGPIFEIAEGGSLVLDNVTIVGKDYLPIYNGGSLYLYDSVSFVQWDEEIDRADGVDTWDGAVTYLNGEVLEAFGFWEDESEDYTETEYIETEYTETEYIETEAPETEYTETEAASEENAESEAIETEAASEENAESEAIETEAASEENAESEAVETEAASEENAESEAAETEAASEENAESEAVETEAVSEENAESEAAETEAASTEEAMNAQTAEEQESEEFSMDAMLDEIQDYIAESEVTETETETETALPRAEAGAETAEVSDLTVDASNAAGSDVLVGIGITTDFNSSDEGTKNQVSSDTTPQSNTGSTDSTSAATETEPATGDSSAQTAVQTQDNSSSQSAAQAQLVTSPVNTGDETSFLVLAVLGMAALAVMSGSVVMRKKVRE